MLEIYEHNKSDCIRLLNMIICEIPFIKSLSDDCLLERLLSLISMITNAFDDHNYQSLDTNVFDSEEERVAAIKEWLLRHYSAKCLIDELNFNEEEDRTRITVLVIHILFKLRHSLKDIQQYLKDYCHSFVELDPQLNPITRFDKLLEMVENDSNRWKSKSRYFKLKLDESKKLIEKYQQNEIFNYDSNPRNQNLYKSRISLNKDSDQTISAKQLQQNNKLFNECKQSSQSIIGFEEQLINGSDSQFEVKSVNNVDLNYMCIECDESYSTKYEYNLHVLKDHKNIDISQIIHNSKDFDFNLLDQSFDKSSQMSKKCKNIKKRVFRCKYFNCGKAFHKSNDLKMHFVRHQPKIDRLLCVYNDYTNAVLNNLRTPSSKAIHLSSNCDHKPKKNKFNANNKSTKMKFDYNMDLNSQLKNGCHQNSCTLQHNSCTLQHLQQSQPLQPLQSVVGFDLSKDSNDLIQLKSDSVLMKIKS